MFKILRHKNNTDTLSRTEAEALVERFLDGSTTLEEERRLYGYFASGKADDSLKRYAAMFGWYANGLAAERRRPSWMRRHAVAVAGVAACAVLAVVFTVGYRNTVERQQELFEVYSGSYIVRDGVRYTDLSEILPEVMAAEKKALASSAVSAQRAPSPEEAVRSVMEETLSNVSDPELRRMMAQDFAN